MMSTKDFAEKQIIFAFLDQGEKISFKNDNLVIKTKEDAIKHQSSCYLLFALFVCGHVNLTSGVLERSARFGFSIVFMNVNMRLYAILPAKAQGNVLLRKKQYLYTQFDIGAFIIANKIQNQKEALQQIRKKNMQIKETILQLEENAHAVMLPNLQLDEIMGLEGIAARSYFQCIFADCNWTARRPRVKHDAINCLLDIGYTFLFNLVEALLEMYGFDTYVGVLHRPFYHRKSLVCDIVEPFRPIIDICLRKAFNLGQIKEEDFSIEQGQYFIFGKKAAPYIKLMVNALLQEKNAIFLYIQTYYRCFMKEKPIQEYPNYFLCKDK